MICVSIYIDTYTHTYTHTGNDLVFRDSLIILNETENEKSLRIRKIKMKNKN